MATRGRGRPAARVGRDDHQDTTAIMLQVAQTMQTVANHMERNTRNPQHPPPAIDPIDVGNTRFAEFRKMNPPTFEGKPDPEAADEWIQEMEKVFDVVLCTEEQKVTFSTHLLQKDARGWWGNARRALGVPTWIVFKTAFYTKYFPASARQAKEVEFLTLRQRTMTIPEYTAKFEDLIRFSPYYELHPDDIWKCNRYKEGLKISLQKMVNHAKVDNFEELTEICQVIETTELKDSRSSLEVSRQNWAPQRSSFKRHAPQRRFQPRGQQTRAPTGVARLPAVAAQPISVVAPTFPECQKCGKNHAGECRAGQGVCYRCGQAGHMIRDCPQVAAGRSCFHCGKSRHLARDCKHGAGPSSARPQRQGRVFTVSAEDAAGSDDLITALFKKMGIHIVKSLIKHKYQPGVSMFIRAKTTSYEYVASRARDPTFEKLMDKYKDLFKVIAIQDLILANPKNQSVSLDFLSRLSQRMHLNRGAASFLRKFPRVFQIYYDPSKLQPFCRLTDASIDVSRQEGEAINGSLSLVIDRLVWILSMSASRTVPLRPIFKVWRELGLPDDFEDSVISANPSVFQLCNAHEPNTHLLKLVDGFPRSGFRAAVEDWRVVECCKEDCSVDRTELRFSFKHGCPPGMRLSKNFKAKVKEWQSLPYVGPYDQIVVGEKKKNSKAGMLAMEKRAVSVVHEFLSLTVEKMVEVEKISHFRKWFGIEFNIRDLFLDHPGIFYLSTKGKRHTVFLREAYERGCLIEPNPVYDARRRLLDLVVSGRRGLHAVNFKLHDISNNDDDNGQQETHQRHNSLSS